MAESPLGKEQRPWSDYGIFSSLEVKENERYGRGVYAVTRLACGTEVMSTKPLVHVLSNDVRGKICDFCLTETKSLVKCSQCKFVRYCNRRCQRDDWKCHRGECRAIAKTLPFLPTPLIRMIVRCLTILTQEGTKQAINVLCSHDLNNEMKEKVSTLMCGIRLLLEKSDSATMKIAHNILCKALCNTFTIYKADLDEIGAGIYIGASLLNHSCLPNCVAVFNGSELAVRTIMTIEPGEQLFLSYVDLLDGHEERQSSLQKTYCFQCQCQRCLTEHRPDSPYYTMHASIGGNSIVMSSDTVGVELSGVKDVDELREKEDYQRMVQEYEVLLSRQALLLHPMHYIIVHTLQRLVYTCIEAEDWSKAIKVSERLTNPLQRYLPKYHPVLAVHYLRQGKLHRVTGTTEHLKQSIEDLTRAICQLTVVYGSDHPCTQETQELLHDTQTELHHRDCR